MTGRRKHTPYRIPSAWYGDTLKQYSLKWDAALMQAAQEIASEETQRWGSTHAPAPLLTNFLFHDSNPHVMEAKKRFIARYRELKRQEKLHRESNYRKELEAAGLTPFPAPGTSGLPEPPVGS